MQPLIFDQGKTGIVGSYFTIERGDKINFIKASLAHAGIRPQSSTIKGRTVGAKLWIVNKDFDETKISANDTNSIWCTNITPNNYAYTNSITGEVNGRKYVITDMINTMDSTNDEAEYTFTFNTSFITDATRMFFGFVNCYDDGGMGLGYVDYKESSLAVPIQSTKAPIKSGVYFTNNPNITIADRLMPASNASLMMTVDKVNITNPDNVPGSSNIPPKIEFSNISYRTHSNKFYHDPEPGINRDDPKTYAQDGWLDGGEIISNGTAIATPYNSPAYTGTPGPTTVYKYIYNNDNAFIRPGFDGYGIPKGRLQDVIFASPNLTKETEADDSPFIYRWVFARSRILFELPHLTRNSNIKIQYKVSTNLAANVVGPNNKPLFKNAYITDTFTRDLNNPAKIVICPRDEGVLDNMIFYISFRRAYSTSGVTPQYSEEVTYAFRTYQKPKVNIAYPKKIRNSVTTGDNGLESRRAKIICNNVASNFHGEGNVRAVKYVSDALTILFASAPTDESDMPMFIRFYLTENRFGRRDIGTHASAFDNDNFDTTIDLFKSGTQADYIQKFELLNGRKTDGTSHKYITNSLLGIQLADNAPILLSGRLNNDTLSTVASTHKLWSYREWGTIADNYVTNDPTVPNAWEETVYKLDEHGIPMVDDSGNRIIICKTGEYVKDHFGPPDVYNPTPTNPESVDDYIKNNGTRYIFDSNGIIQQSSSPLLLFRAGYIYLLRLRMFHGASVGALGKATYPPAKKSLAEASYGFTGTYQNSGDYDYRWTVNYGCPAEADHSKLYNYCPANAQTDPQYGNSTPYKGWHGPEDGTSGINMQNVDGSFNTEINKTYPGFSTVDYTIFEAIAPYSSRSNLVTKHPTSNEISANQWITFNYRHLNKNLSFIDATNGMPGQTNNPYGKALNNTITRIRNMYRACTAKIKSDIDAIMSSLTYSTEGYSQTAVLKDLKIWLNPRSEDASESRYEDYDEEGNLIYVTYGELCNNSPIYNNGNSSNTMTGWSGPLPTDSSAYKWPEFKIISEVYNEGDGNSGSNPQDPKGNTYRWQVVINAQTSPSVTLPIPGVTAPDSSLVGLPVLSNYIPISTYSGDVQTYYYYKDINTVNPDMSCYGHTIEFNPSRRFTIFELGGVTGKNNHGVPGWPAFYTTSSSNKSKNAATPSYGTRTQVDIYTRFFDLRTTVANETSQNPNDEESYGQIFKRVPLFQDCENGIPTTAFGINAKLPVTVDTAAKMTDLDEQIVISSTKSSLINELPLVRVTHYLFFKSWIRTSFRTEFKYTIYWSTEDDSDNYDVDDSKPYDYSGDGGLSQVYGEDNNNWGRCLSADDSTAKKIDKEGNRVNSDGQIAPYDKYDTQTYGPSSISSNYNTSGGIEIPILVRYTPLLQPKLASTTYKPTTSSTDVAITNNSMSVTPSECKCDCGTIHRRFDLTIVGDDGISSSLASLEEFNLNLYYPFIPENKTYYTHFANGGNGNTSYNNYNVDKDSNPDLKAGDNANQNTDFFGGYGICNAYNVLLVPSDPDLSKLLPTEEAKYNVDGKWNYFNQPANYYKHYISSGNIHNIYDITSKKQPDAKTVVVGYKVRPSQFTNYQKDGEIIIGTNPVDKGRAFATLKINVTKICEAKICNSDSDYDKTTTTFEDKLLLDKLAKDINPNTKENYHSVKSGVIYDLVIIPIYSTDRLEDYCYENGAGTINGQPYGGGATNKKGGDITKAINYYGSNPLIYYNYLAVGSPITGSWCQGNCDCYCPPPRPGYKKCCDGSEIPVSEKCPDCPNNCQDGTPKDYTKYPDTGCPPCLTCDDIEPTDHTIVFPNIDNDMFNNDEGNNHNVTVDGIGSSAMGHIKESPGFWINNSFKLILRMPSYYKKGDSSTPAGTTNTIDYQSGGIITDSANNFMFEDIQIHIGKISELESVGYPDDDQMNIKLNAITDQEKLADLHIISYKDFFDKDVFSKTLNSNYEDIVDNRSVATAGSLSPTYTDIDGKNHYSNRFIEVNLSNAYYKKTIIKNGIPEVIYKPISESFTPEGYYIQFRVKTAYSVGISNVQWSRWHGGSVDGGQSWWGVEKSHKGIHYRIPVRNYNDIHTEFRNHIKESFPGALINNAEVGKGTQSIYGDSIVSAKPNPNNATPPRYHHIGTGNDNSSLTVPDIGPTTIDWKGNTDDPYNTDINYKTTHDTKFTIPTNITTWHQHMWEMLYIDFIIRNMSKLYYKPFDKLLPVPKQADFDLSLKDKCNRVLDYRTWAWDDMEYQLFEKNGDVSNFTSTTQNKDHNEKASSPGINGLRTLGPNAITAGTITNRNKWNRNKYYRKIISKQDFDELNRHLEDLVTFIRNEAFTGNHCISDWRIGNNFVIPKFRDTLDFYRSRKLLIGNKTNSDSGLGPVNNINHSMMSSNYIQNLWSNIQQICESGVIFEDTRNNDN